MKTKLINDADIFTMTQPDPPSLNSKQSLSLHEVYASPSEHIGEKSEQLLNLYPLPLIESVVTLNDHDRPFYDTKTARADFLSLAIYSADGQIFLNVAIRDEKIEFALPVICINRYPTIENAIADITQLITGGGKVCEIEPVAILQHIFKRKIGASDEQRAACGLAYIARSTAAADVSGKKLLAPYGAFFSIEDVAGFIRNDQVNRFSDAKVLEHVIDRVNGFLKLAVEAPDYEISQNREAIVRYRIHNRFVKPVFYHLKKTRQFNDAINKAIGKPDQFLDASCGDSSLIFKVSERGARLCVGNDISRSHTDLLQQKLKPCDRHKIFFTNHNIVDLRFADKVFDVALLKNTLHHFSAKNECELAIKNLLRVAKKVIIVEVENPKSHIFSRCINQYYVKFLKDAGSHFFYYAQFQNGISETVQKMGNYRVQFHIFKTLHGNWMFAEIEEKI